VDGKDEWFAVRVLGACEFEAAEKMRRRRIAIAAGDCFVQCHEANFFLRLRPFC
jgi:hypothetical protein